MSYNLMCLKENENVWLKLFLPFNKKSSYFCATFCSRQSLMGIITDSMKAMYIVHIYILYQSGMYRVDTRQSIHCVDLYLLQVRNVQGGHKIEYTLCRFISFTSQECTGWTQVRMHTVHIYNLYQSGMLQGGHKKECTMYIFVFYTSQEYKGGHKSKLSFGQYITN